MTTSFRLTGRLEGSNGRGKAGILLVQQQQLVFLGLISNLIARYNDGEKGLGGGGFRR